MTQSHAQGAPFKAATITLSDLASRGEREDSSGALLQELLREAGAAVASHEILPDDRNRLRDRLIELSEVVDAIITTGGTGIAPRDFTPEATLDVIEKRIPGIEHALPDGGTRESPNIHSVARCSRGTRPMHYH